MTGTAHAGLAVEALVVVLAVLFMRWAVTGGTPRTRRPRPVEEWEPAYLWLPAQQLACPDCGTTIHTRGETA